uniref:phosphoglycerate dehydrogenase n=1 Tax=Timspurckia oligopyrenoides TaxID=708627 RepID=A0A7S0ZAC9_9RHOD|mmetsp:Transcript_10019/g.18042  ORF Transcript_10019/g.18042 Transcript_10019/m.18042 type:complete len:440 (+) Transcript_10019:53-1372(+)
MSSSSARSPAIMGASPARKMEWSIEHLSLGVSGNGTSFPKDKINILVLENVSTTAKDMLASDGFHVESEKRAFTEDELIERIENIHVLGIRSKTKVTQRVMESGKKLLAIGCFCIGTDQVDLDFAEKKGIAVFNAPFANTRSVAELVIAEIIALSRRLSDTSAAMHQGIWNKSALGCYEVRGKTLGIVGYGHIGSQLSVLAEMMGMKVIFYDHMPKLPLGNSESRADLASLLIESDVVSVHVPKSEQTFMMFREEHFALMKKGAYFINNARGTVADLDALAAVLKSGHLGGAAVDVFPIEPEKNGPFTNVLQGCPNTILTPHIGGSTHEAQDKIGEEVASALLRFINQGSTTGSVNLPNVEMPVAPFSHRILNIHENVPGVLRDINNIFAALNVNVRAQVLGTTNNVGYLIIDVDKVTSVDTKNAISALPASLRTRLLY